MQRFKITVDNTHFLYPNIDPETVSERNNIRYKTFSDEVDSLAELLVVIKGIRKEYNRAYRNVNSHYPDTIWTAASRTNKAGTPSGYIRIDELDNDTPTGRQMEIQVYVKYSKLEYVAIFTNRSGNNSAYSGQLTIPGSDLNRAITNFFTQHVPVRGIRAPIPIGFRQGRRSSLNPTGVVSILPPEPEPEPMPMPEPEPMPVVPNRRPGNAPPGFRWTRRTSEPRLVPEAPAVSTPAEAPPRTWGNTFRGVRNTATGFWGRLFGSKEGGKRSRRNRNRRNRRTRRR